MRRILLLLAALAVAAFGCGTEPETLAYEDQIRGWDGEILEGELEPVATTTSTSTTTTSPQTVEPDIVIVATTAPPEPVTDFRGTLIFRHGTKPERNLHALSLATLQTRQLTDVAEGQEVTEAKLSPNGKLVAYFIESEDGEAVGYLHVVDLESGAHTQLSDFRSLLWKFAWSADSTRVFYNGQRLGDAASRVFAFDVADGRSTTARGPMGNAMILVGSGPGALVYFQYTDDGDHVLVHADPDTLEVVSATPMYNYIVRWLSNDGTTVYGSDEGLYGDATEVDAFRLTPGGLVGETLNKAAMQAIENASPDGTLHWLRSDRTLLLGPSGDRPSVPLTESPEEVDVDTHWMPDSAGVVFSVSKPGENRIFRELRIGTPGGQVTHLEQQGYIVGVSPLELGYLERSN